jgi:hypothetical protein
VRKQFDKVLSVGHACDVAHQVRRHFQQTEAYPFDWLTTPLDGLVRLVENDFADFLDETVLVAEGKYLRDARYGVRFLHEFENPARFRDNLADVRAKYERRIERWRRLMESGPSVLFVRSEQYVNAANIDEAKARALLALLRRKYARADVHLLVQNPPAAGISEVIDDNLWLLQLKVPEPWIWSGDDVAWSEMFDRVTGRAG